jgi:DNA-binding MarR family transcriptional regulator
MMNETPEVSELATALVNLSHHVLHLFAEVGRTYKLSQQQVELICAVIVPGKAGMSELGRLLHLEKSNLSNLVDRMEQRGLALRTRDPDDRRATLVELTEEGTRLGMQTYGEVTARLSRLIDRLSVADRQHLTAVVQQLMTEDNQTTPA